MNGIIDVGGGMRGAYTAGIYDYFIDHNIQFDYCIGISAGSANMCNYLSGQRGRNILSYTVYSKEPEYMGVGNFRQYRTKIVQKIRSQIFCQIA